MGQKSRTKKTRQANPKSAAPKMAQALVRSTGPSLVAASAKPLPQSGKILATPLMAGDERGDVRRIGFLLVATVLLLAALFVIDLQTPWLQAAGASVASFMRF